MEFESQHIVYEASGTKYEISVSLINNKDSNFNCQYLVSLVNYGECFFESDLNFIGEAIIRSSNIFGGIDAMNIQNAIADKLSFVKPVVFNIGERKLIKA